jgi:hypothetical protein
MKASSITVKKLVIKSGITGISHSYFQYKSQLTSVECEESCTLEKIGNNAFWSASSLTSFPSKTIKTITTKQ